MDERDTGSWKYQKARDLDLKGRDRMCSELREVGLIGASLHGIARLLTRFLLFCFVRIKSEGMENLPCEAPFVLVANHSSHLDALIISWILPARFTGKFFSLAAADYFFDTPSKTVFATRWVNALPLKRGRGGAKALGGLKERLTGGDCIFIVFPEGTRSRDGKMNPFKPGLGMLVAGTEVPVVPCYLKGAFKIWPADRKFPRPGSVKLSIGEPMIFASAENNKAGWLEIRAQLEAAVIDLGQQTSDEEDED
ncbi:MAG: lysophospholipid acyltransferase family protein [Verrucomicrobiales bacterium]|nr:lysophospholipid acyltransferase family protein [Verrucomicrobiales bacterium]